VPGTIEWLEKAYYTHDTDMPQISVDPICDGLRGDTVDLSYGL
jgi:hypothetical protein